MIEDDRSLISTFTDYPKSQQISQASQTQQKNLEKNNKTRNHDARPTILLRERGTVRKANSAQRKRSKQGGDAKPSLLRM